jgi:hypothetical protein
MWSHRKWLLPLVIIAVVAGCEPAPAPSVPPEWQTVRAGTAFTFKAPPDLEPAPVQGIDSFVGKYESPTLEVTFDYGRYSDPMNGEGYRSRGVTVDGKSARLVSKGDVVAIHFPNIGGETKLTMCVRLKNADAKTAETLLQSIDFQAQPR